MIQSRGVQASSSSSSGGNQWFSPVSEEEAFEAPVREESADAFEKAFLGVVSWNVTEAPEINVSKPSLEDPVGHMYRMVRNWQQQHNGTIPRPMSAFTLRERIFAELAQGVDAEELLLSCCLDGCKLCKTSSYKWALLSFAVSFVIGWWKAVRLLLEVRSRMANSRERVEQAAESGEAGYLAGDMAEEGRELFQEAMCGFEVLVFGRLLPWGKVSRDLRAWLQDTGQVPVQGELANSPRERELSRRPSLAKRECFAGDLAEEDRELFQEAISGFEVLVFGRLLPLGEFCRDLRAWFMNSGEAPVGGALANDQFERQLSRRLSLAKRECLAGNMAEKDRELFHEAIGGLEVLVFGRLLPWGELPRVACLVAGYWSGPQTTREQPPRERVEQAAESGEAGVLGR
ncbi:unnamed protein product [Prorocentrum cordatum]|uniref:Uncharacterized protein n=1 Tax=Prorocentrum cordatum TaxID=2364126 RepID=A0ABN9W510_9DINO|nr:unnamed protein product [Polarella glacialis]